jgi:hypothetical protein
MVCVACAMDGAGSSPDFSSVAHMWTPPVWPSLMLQVLGSCLMATASRPAPNHCMLAPSNKPKYILLPVPMMVHG